MNKPYTFTLDIPSIGTINARAFTLKEYFELGVAKIEGRFKDEVQNVVYKCTGQDIYSLDKPEAEYIVAMLWMHSLGEINHESEYQCECGNEFTIPITFNQIQIDPTKELLKGMKGFSLIFNPAKIYGDSDKVMTFLNSMSYIIIDNEQVAIEDLSEQELSDLQSFITYEDVINITDELLEPTIRLGIPVKCEKCGSYHVHEFNGLTDFMEIINV